MSEETAAPPAAGPATLDDLKLVRTRFAFAFSGGFVVSLIMAAVMNGVLTNASLPQGLSLVLAIIWIIILLLPSVAVVLFAPEAGIPHWWLLLPISIIPIVSWIAFTIVESYVPPHLRGEQPDTGMQPWSLAVIGFLPCAVMLLCTVVSPSYMNQLYFGPPWGANIPAIDIPCGWPIMLGICGAVGLANYSLWVSAIRLKVQHFAITAVLVIVLLVFPALWFGLLGPAAVQVFKQFYGN